MKRVIIAIIFFYIASCSVKEKEKEEVKTAEDSFGRAAIANSNKVVVSDTVNFEKYLNVTAIDSISINSINKKVFELEQSGLFFLAFSRDKIAANLHEEESLIDVYNPFSGKVYSQIDLMKYAKDFLRENIRGGYTPSETKLGRNNTGKVKIMITDDAGVPSTAFFAISNLELPNLKTNTLVLNSNKKRLFIEDYNKVFNFDELLFYNDSLYYIYDLEEISFSKGDTLLYKINFVNNDMILGNGNVIKNGNDYCVLKFPYKDKLFFYKTDSNDSELFSYNIITGESKMYVIPLSPFQFYFAEDGFFMAYMPEGQESSEMYRYSFVQY
ncbi:hypothetical protein [Sporocytophaga myxococcoides]|uniref:hypothetical protein n=1 Tax=Sporocytophaga myxococcoides TaxID=153721 RepID=UPI000413C5BA|nr:hypothetical protein [Sporocytophaga myxococcoides]